jgi:hypothetical protein
VSTILDSFLLFPSYGIVAQTAGPLNLGSASDWAIAVGLLLTITGLLAAVWKLARAAGRLETAIETLTKQQADQEARSKVQWDQFQTFQKEATTSINELRLAVSRLTWEMKSHSKDRDKELEEG